jgi:hypothetical protein
MPESHEPPTSATSRRGFLCAGAACAAAGVLPACLHAQSKPAQGKPTESAAPAQEPASAAGPLIGYCGYNCGLCPGRSENHEQRLKMIQGWNKIYGHDYTPDKVPASQPCAGCKGQGELADKQCQARPCAAAKGVQSCAECGEFPCRKVGSLIADRNTLLLRFFQRPDATREEYDLCARQFESVPNLIRILIDKGKLPAWVRDFYLHA